MAGNDDVRVRIGGDNRGLNDALRESDRLINRFSTRGTGAMRSFTAGISSAFSSLFSLRGAMAAAAGVGGLALLVNKSIEAADSIAKMSDKTGVGIEALQELMHAANLAGVEHEALGKALSQLNKNASQAAAGMASYKDAFDKAGVSVKNAQGQIKPTEQLFMEIADSIGGMSNAARKADIAMTIFGRAGAALLPLFKDGAEGIRQMREEARKLGIVLDASMVREAEKAQDAMTRVGSAIKSQVMRAVLQLTPQIIELADAFANQLVPAIRDFLAWLSPTRFATLDQLQEKISATEAKIAGLAGMSFRDVLKQPSLEVFGKNAEQIKALLVELTQLDDALKRRARLQALYNAASKSGADADYFYAAKVAELRKDLEFEVDQLGRSKAEQKLYNLAKSAGIEVNDKLRASLGPLIQKLEEAGKVTEIFRGLDEQVKTAQRAIETIDATEGAQARANAEAKIRASLDKEEITLSQEKEAALQRYLDTLGRSTDELEREKRAREIFLENRGAAIEYGKSIDALALATDKYGLTADEVRRKQRDLRIQLLETQTDGAAGLERAMLKLGKQAEDSAAIMESAFTSATDRMSDAISEFVSTGRLDFKSFVQDINRELAKIATKQLMAQLFGAGMSGGNGALGGLLTKLAGSGGSSGPASSSFTSSLGDGLFTAKGAGFASGIRFMARGGLLEKPTAFMTKGGLAIGGEAGTEAVMPLKRGKDGRLGVSAEDMGGGGPRALHVHFHGVRDFDSFQRNRDQIAGDLSRAGQRAFSRNGYR